MALIIAPREVGRLIRRLRRDGYRVIGPTVRDGAVVYDELGALEDLPVGVGDRQAPGSYRLEERGDGALFGYAVGPHSWRRYLFPPRQRLWRSIEEPDGITVQPEASEAPRFAFLGVRGCELAAIHVQDRVFLADTLTDTVYALRRQDLLIVGVNCGSPAGTCFCVSTNTGPRVGHGADLVLTELLDGGRHELLVEADTPRGGEILAGLTGRSPSEADRTAADAVVEAASGAMGRSLDTDGIRGLLARNLEHPRWDDVADRCLACGNCTMVCPTCFCNEVEDVADLDGTRTERWRRWDSCFTASFTHTPEGSSRASTRSRYRQWLTHKLGTWHDQFDTSGCVGCGRCLTWCPVGIDITEEAAAIRATNGARTPEAS